MLLLVPVESEELVELEEPDLALVVGHASDVPDELALA